MVPGGGVGVQGMVLNLDNKNRGRDVCTCVCAGEGERVVFSRRTLAKGLGGEGVVIGGLLPDHLSSEQKGAGAVTLSN